MDPPAAAPATAADAPPEVPVGGTGPRWSAPTLALALILLSALPLTLSRLLNFESSYPSTADEWAESTGAWTGFVVLPLAVAAGLLAVRSRFAWALPVASGLVLGTGLVLVEHALFWVCDFIYYRSNYNAGPALWLLVVGAAVVVAAAVVVLVRPPLAGRARLRTDWRVACAIVVVACVLWFVVSGPDADGAARWISFYEGTFLLGGAALAGTLLWLSSEQRVAALVGLTLFGLWSIYWIVREIGEDNFGFEPGVSQAELIGVVVTLLACYVAQTGPARRPEATTSASQ